MFGVIFLGNASLTLQTCYAAAYLILNAAYWTVAALPQQWNWDLSCFNVERLHCNEGEECKTFTEAMWKAIAITRSIEWVKIRQVGPISPAWTQWHEEAGRMAEQAEPNAIDSQNQIKLPEWNYERALSEYLNPAKNV